MLRQTLLAALAIGATVTAMPRVAEAVVTYTLVGQQYAFTDPNIPQAIQTRPFTLSFTVSDAAVARGSLSVNIRGGGEGDSSPPIVTGNGADLLSANVSIDLVTTTRIVGTFNLAASFLPNGSISNASLEVRGRTADAIFSGTSSSLLGAYTGDGFGGCSSPFSQSPVCTLSGQLVASGAPSAVPEPMSLALLGVGLLGMTVLARRQS